MPKSLRFIRFGSIATAALLCSVSAQGTGADAYTDARNAFQDAYRRATANFPDESATDSEVIRYLRIWKPPASGRH